MLYSEIVERLKTGPFSVTYTKGIEEQEGYGEPNMRATVTAVESVDSYGTIKVRVSYKDFEQYNRAFESSNYYDKQGRACLNARQAGFYKEEENIYGSPDTPWPFEIHAAPRVRRRQDNGNSKEDIDAKIKSLQAMLKNNPEDSPRLRVKIEVARRVRSSLDRIFRPP